MYKTIFDWLILNKYTSLWKIDTPASFVNSKKCIVVAKISLYFFFENRNCLIVKMSEIMYYVSDFEVEYSSESDSLSDKSVFSSDLIYQHPHANTQYIRISMDIWRLAQAMIRTQMISPDLISTGKRTICREEQEINTLG